ncbi:chromosome partitioning protein [Actinotalea ferrariae CF5-4]|uniref:non-specific protein-tyrosine kinase n=1 Tax=Actinotalea ferrariae CF5-4 TaxID=948458 RepID=A0A021VVD9_9CELL|nr:chromosome partitioning protein [Actinotalea ferrariae CF5-4]
MEFQDYVAILRKRWVSILVVALAVVAAALAATLAATPSYQARSQVYVSVRSGGTTADLVQGSNYTQRQVKSYSDLVTSPLVLAPVIEELGLDTRAEVLALAVTATPVVDTSLINISVTDEDPGRAAAVADALAASLAVQVNELEPPTADGQSPVLISTVRPAVEPSAPASPSPTRNLALGLLLGLAAGFGVAVLREMLDTKVRDEDHVAQVTESAVIAAIPHDDSAVNDHLIVQSNPMSLVAESFRRLRTNLQFLSAEEQPRALIVTSSLPEEGKSTTAANLALTLADSGARVILVDADLRRPSVANYMGLEGTAGLTTVLIGRASLEDVVQPWGAGHLHVLTSGQIPPNPSELLGSQAMAHLLGQLVQRYDHVIIDTPPLLPVTDAAVLARLTGGAIVVVGAHKVHRHQLEEGIRSLETVNARVLGIVLNRVARKQSETYAYDYSSDPSQTPRSVSERRSDAPPPPRRSTKAASAEGLDLTGTRLPAQGVAGLDAALGGRGGNRWPGEPLGEPSDQAPRHSRA